MAALIDGGVVLKNDKLRSLLENLNDENHCVGLAIKTIGRDPDPTTREHSAKVQIFPIFQKIGEDILTFVPTRYYIPTEGVGLGFPDVPSGIADFRFENHGKMDIEHEGGKKFCFSFIHKQTISGILGNSNTDFVLLGATVKQEGNEAFTLYFQKINSRGLLTFTAPCPPYWKYGPPVEAVSSFKRKKY
ncbi:MAG: hypothetical protein IPN76_23000 [Saprospiraceae bacterium]|nr:hypothetical protein [Saprospiraceae bacterium]